MSARAHGIVDWLVIARDAIGEAETMFVRDEAPAAEDLAHAYEAIGRGIAALQKQRR